MAIERMRTTERLASIDSSLNARFRRLKRRFLTILQVALASGLAFWAARALLDHELPFFAPISTIIVIGLSAGGFTRRARDLSLACVIGVLVGDVLVWLLGGSIEPWSIAAMVAVALAAAALASPSELVSNQVGIGTVLIATILPPGAEITGIDRTLDAVVGTTLGLLVVALVPSSALKVVRHEIAQVLMLKSSVLGDVADGLRERDSDVIADALSVVRGSQSNVDAMTTAARHSREATTISPLLWKSKRNARSMERMMTPVDNSVRTVRVLARRAYVLTRDGDPATPEQIHAIEELSQISMSLARVFEEKSGLRQSVEVPELVRRLRIVAGQLSMSVAGENAVLSNYALLAQTRSLVVDLLQICGMSPDSAVAMLATTSKTPAVPPEVWKR